MTKRFNDPYTRANENLSVSPDWDVDLQAGDAVPKIISNELVMSITAGAPGANTTAHCRPVSGKDMDTADHAVTSNVRLSVVGAGDSNQAQNIYWVRSTNPTVGDGNNAYDDGYKYFIFETGDLMQRRVLGVNTTIANTGSESLSVSDQELEFSAIGTAITAKLDSVTSESATDSNITTGVRHGMTITSSGTSTNGDELVSPDYNCQDNAYVAPTSSAGANKASPRDVPIALAGSGTGNNITYQWTQNGGVGTVSFLDSTDPTTTVTADATELFNLDLIATDDSGFPSVVSSMQYDAQAPISVATPKVGFGFGGAQGGPHGFNPAQG